MDDHASLARRGAARFLIGLLAALCLAVPVLAAPGEKPEEKDEAARAAKVVKKVARALQKARKAEEEPVEADRRALRKFHEEVMEYAELHAKQVANFIKVAGNQQVQIEVRFAEVRRSGMKEVGLNLFQKTRDDISQFGQPQFGRESSGPFIVGCCQTENLTEKRPPFRIDSLSELVGDFLLG